MRRDGGSEKETGSQGKGFEISKDSASMGLTKAEAGECSWAETLEARWEITAKGGGGGGGGVRDRVSSQ